MSLSMVALWRRALPIPIRLASTTSGRVTVILDRLDFLGGQVGVPDHATVRGDEGDPRRQDAAQSVRLRVELLLAGRRAVREELRGHARVARQLVLDALLEITADRRRHERRRRGDGKRRGRERGQEDLGAERHGRSGLSGDRRACSRIA